MFTKLFQGLSNLGVEVKKVNKSKKEYPESNIRKGKLLKSWDRSLNKRPLNSTTYYREFKEEEQKRLLDLEVKDH